MQIEALKLSRLCSLCIPLLQVAFRNFTYLTYLVCTSKFHMYFRSGYARLYKCSLLVEQVGAAKRDRSGVITHAMPLSIVKIIIRFLSRTLSQTFCDKKRATQVTSLLKRQSEGKISALLWREILQIQHLVCLQFM